LALALERANPEDRQELLALVDRKTQGSQLVGLEIIERMRSIFARAQVFEKAEKLVEKFRARAEASADGAEPTELRELLYFLVDTILERPAASPVPTDSSPLVQLST
jgi:geranylgeranyl pyrophosphate synthase